MYLVGLPIAFILIGALLALWGWRGRRSGNTLFCGRCGYNLTGAPTDTCPECGVSITAKTVRIGEKRRRVRLLLVGIVLLVFGGLCLVASQLAAFRDYDWYQLKPTLLVLKDARSPAPARPPGFWVAPAPPLHQRAFDELKRREKAGKLDTSQKEAVISAAVSHWRRRKTPIDPPNAMEEHIETLFLSRSIAGSLTSRDLDQIGKASVHVSWEARPIASLRIPVPVEFDFAISGRFLSIIRVITVDSFEILREGRLAMEIPVHQMMSDLDTYKPLQLVLPSPFVQPIDMVRTYNYDGPGGMLDRVTRWRSGINLQESGHYEIRMNLRVLIYRSVEGAQTRDSLKSASLISETALVLTASSDVRDVPAEEVVREIRGEPDRTVLLKRLRFMSAKSSPYRNGGPRIEADMPLPVDVVGSVSLVRDGTGYTAGSIELRRQLAAQVLCDYQLFADDLMGASTSVCHLGGPPWEGELTGDLGDRIDHWPRASDGPVNLRIYPDRNAAARTVDIDTIFGEVIELEGIPSN